MANIGIGAQGSGTNLQINLPSNVTDRKAQIRPSQINPVTAADYKNGLFTAVRDDSTGAIKGLSISDQVGNYVITPDLNLSQANQTAIFAPLSDAMVQSQDYKNAVLGNNQSYFKSLSDSAKVITVGDRQFIAVQEPDGDVLISANLGSKISPKESTVVAGPDGTGVVSGNDQNDEISPDAAKVALRGAGFNADKVLNLNQAIVAPGVDDSDSDVTADRQRDRGETFYEDGNDIQGHLELTGKKHEEHVYTYHDEHKNTYKLPPQISEKIEENNIYFKVETPIVEHKSHTSEVVQSRPNMFDHVPSHKKVPIHYGNTSVPTLPGIPVTPETDDVPPPGVKFPEKVKG